MLTPENDFALRTAQQDLYMLNRIEAIKRLSKAMETIAFLKQEIKEMTNEK